VIDEDAVIDKLIRIAPLAIGGFLLYKVLESGLAGDPGRTLGEQTEKGQVGTGQWMVQVKDELGNWGNWATYDTEKNAKNAAKQVRKAGYEARVVRR
jgi:hypothetical protein